jgi:8-oxo-dGTP diphosphatase
MSIQDYPHPALTADVVLFSVGEEDLKVLLIQRDKPPFEGAWAFPGGFVNVGEAPRDTARRELEEETNIKGVFLEQLRTFGDPERDPRGHVVTVAYLAVIPMGALRRAEAGSDAAQARWWSLEELPPLAFDHADILTCALQRFRSKVACLLEEPDVLPEDLSLGELRTACALAVRTVQENTDCS